MGFLSKKKLQYSIDSAAERLSEEVLYEKIAREIESGEKRKGLWTKAKALSHGDESKAEGVYVELRMQSMIDDIILEQDRKAREKVAEKERLAQAELRFVLSAIVIGAIIVFANLNWVHKNENS